ncbi:MAG: undecaprenyl/decaprenyl-phosphate alpha-N-acetylglucosaminyl 1-phosphate transferase [Clostridia bacterium]|nr:undecaprenyl/decaprenyl-phosphate alpha-N-acetylglucosaminyl 1-phosphate transferase [Clostridia bacterium]
MSVLNIFLALAVSFLTSFLSVPFVKNIAVKAGAIDYPKDGRRMHNKPIPRLGGISIFYGFIISILCFGNLDRQLWGIIIGAVIIVSLGIIDDIKALNAKPKFFIQLAASIIPVIMGSRIVFVSVPFANQVTNIVFSDILSYVISVLWIVGVTNAVNLIDGLDGLAAGVSTIASASIFFIALINGNAFVTLISVILVGACLGFLPYNLNPASIFMGDTGATFLGYIMAVMSIQGMFKSYTLITFVVPVLILGLPLFDTSFAIIRRIIKHKPIMEADRGHLHHRLIDMGFNQKQTVIILYTISALLGLSSIIMEGYDEQTGILLLVSVFVFVLLAIIFAGNPLPDKKTKNEKIEKETDSK